MEKFVELLQVAEKLLGPEGCPWDQKQTFQSLQPYILEEAHEVIEAVDQDDDSKMIEELGDLLYTIIFYGKLAEKLQRFSMEQIIESVTDKLIRRHPHIFGNVKVETMEDIFSNWEEIKKREKHSKNNDMPPTLPGLIRGQKILKKLHRAGFALLYRNNLKNREFDKEAFPNFDLERRTIVRAQGMSEDQNLEIEPTRSKTDSSSCFGIEGEKAEKITEEEMGKRLLSLLIQANDNDLDAESVLRKTLNKLLEQFQKWEAKTGKD